MSSIGFFTRIGQMDVEYTRASALHHFKSHPFYSTSSLINLFILHYDGDVHFL